MTESFDIPFEAAELYEAKFVPLLFKDWSEMLVARAGIAEGHRVLDVACGTGSATRVAAARAGASGTVAGIDLNEDMLAVARRVLPDVEFRRGDAASLPYSDASFDVALCQSALFFVPDVAAVLRELARVVVEGGTVAVQVWDALEAQPAYAILVDVAERHAGEEVAATLRTYWALGDRDALASRMAAAGLRIRDAFTGTTTMDFPSLDDFVETEARATPLGDALGDGYQAFHAEVVEALRSFEVGGRAPIPISGHILIATRP